MFNIPMSCAEHLKEISLNPLHQVAASERIHGLGRANCVGWTDGDHEQWGQWGVVSVVSAYRNWVGERPLRSIRRRKETAKIEPEVLRHSKKNKETLESQKCHLIAFLQTVFHSWELQLTSKKNGDARNHQNWTHSMPWLAPCSLSRFGPWYRQPEFFQMGYATYVSHNFGPQNSFQNGWSWCCLMMCV